MGTSAGSLGTPIPSSKLKVILNCGCKRELKPDPIPIFICRLRRISFKWVKRVEMEWERLEKVEDIEKRSFSDWATLLMPVVKANKEIRSCPDYSATFIRYVRVQRHSIKKSEENHLYFIKWWKIVPNQDYLQKNLNSDY